MQKKYYRMKMRHGVLCRDYLRAQKEPISKGFFMHIGIDDFGAINSSRGADYGNHILKSVADCMESCLSDNQRLYHLVADQYVIVDLEASSSEDAVVLKEKITDKLHNFIVAENYEAIFSISIGVIDAATFCEGTEECRKKFEFALKQAKSMAKNGFYIFDQDDYEVFLRHDNGRRAGVCFTNGVYPIIGRDRIAYVLK